MTDGRTLPCPNQGVKRAVSAGPAHRPTGVLAVVQSANERKVVSVLRQQLLEWHQRFAVVAG